MEYIYIMAKTYVCKYCKYQTPIKTNFNVHTDSLKHQERIRELTIKCVYCRSNIDKLEIESHYLTCDNKILIDEIVLSKINDTPNSIATKLEAEYDAKLTKLNDLHRAELSKIEKKSYNSINYQIRERKKECDNIKLEYKKEFDNLRLEHAKEIDKIKQECKENIDYYKKELSAANATIFSAQSKHIEATENSKKEMTIVKEKEIARMETVMKTCGKITEKSVSGICNAITFANAQFTSAPVLTKICNFDFVDDCECVDDLVHNYLENTMHQYIGDIITALYKKDTAGDQSFWNTDSSRLGYIIRQKVDAQVLWGKDVNADRITKLVLAPIIEFFIECVDDKKTALKKFIKKNDDCPKHSKMYDRILKKEALCKNLILVKTALLDTKLNKNIIKYITPKFNISVLMLAKK
jgi:hypothetical protein